MTLDEITEKITSILIEEFEIAEENIFPEASLKKGLGLDSLDMVDVVVFVKECFGVSLSTADFAGIETFYDFCKYIHAKQTK